MLFSKPSKKTRKKAEEATAAADVVAPVEASKPRSTRSSKSKSSEASETGSVKHRKAAAKVAPAVSETTIAETPLKSVAAAASATQSPAVQEVVAISAQVSERKNAKLVITREQIAALAYSYYVARNYTHGSSEQDWLRAEYELNTAR